MNNTLSKREQVALQFTQEDAEELAMWREHARLLPLLKTLGEFLDFGRANAPTACMTEMKITFSEDAMDDVDLTDEEKGLVKDAFAKPMMRLWASFGDNTPLDRINELVDERDFLKSCIDSILSQKSKEHKAGDEKFASTYKEPIMYGPESQKESAPTNTDEG